MYAPEEMNHKEALNTQEPVATFDLRQRLASVYCRFYAPKESGQMGVFPMQAVTVGDIATEEAQAIYSTPV